MLDESPAKTLIVGPGRTGSTLLAAILSDVGANFGLDGIESWDPADGAYEHPLAHAAYRDHQRSRRLGASLVPDRLGRRPFARRRDRSLGRLLSQVDFVKSSTLVWLVPRIARLGYRPTILVSFRDFDGYARSRHRRFGLSAWELVEHYRDVYLTALLQLEIFGGGVVDHAALVDPGAVRWADPLAELAGVEPSRLLERRAARLAPTERRAPAGSAIPAPLLETWVSPVEEACRRLAGTFTRP